MKIRAAAFLLISTALLLAQPAEVELSAEPSHHLQLQNDFVRVFKVEIPPQGATLLHRHRNDYFMVAPGGLNLASEVPGKASRNIRLSAGETSFFAGGFAHVSRNLSAAASPHVDIEVLHPNPSYRWDEQRGLSVLEGGTHEILLVKDGIRASETDLQPHAMVPRHRHLGPHLLVALGELDLENAVPGQPVKHIRMKSGEAAWVAGGITHMLMNAASAGQSL